MNLVDTFQNRLKYAMNMRNMKQVDLVEKSGLDKTLINKYLAGISKARQKKLTILADTLDVNEVWLMGYDVSIERELDSTNIKDSNSAFKNVPVIGKIAAGKPILAQENIEGYLPVDPTIYGLTTAEDLFLLKVSRRVNEQKS